jgi:signal transduction histidine kinase
MKSALPANARIGRGPAAAAHFAHAVALVQAATASRLAFAALAAVTAYLGAGWLAAPVWFVAMAGWEVGLRPFLERRISPPLNAETQARAYRLMAGVHFFGAIGYSALPLASWASGTAIGEVLAAAWLCGAASYAFVYFSNNRAMLAANLGPAIAVAVLAPLAAGDGDWLERVLGAIVLLTMLAAMAVFARDRNALLKSLADEAEARENAEGANEAKRQFLAIISHELRTPLNCVVGYAEMLREELELKGEAQLTSDAAQIAGSGRSLLGLVNRIIMLARLESGGIEVETVDARLSDLVNDAAASARVRAELNGNRLIVHTDRMGIGALDADKARQCIGELCANAAKFTKGGQIDVIARRTKVHGQETLHVDVADTGIGVEEALMGRIFQPFVQGEGRADRRFEGAGAGLAVVRGLARLMGGDVTCKNRRGGGALFTLQIPLASASASGRAAA